jgi:hypothetical protein
MKGALSAVGPLNAPTGGKVPATKVSAYNFRQA